jgi:hypothetical protein
MYRAYRVALLAVCILIPGCGTLTLQPKTAPNAMDVTMGKYRDSDAQRYILVTMTNAVHEELVKGERVDAGNLPPLYAQFLANLARTYGLRRVADWPLTAIDIRCLVFEVSDPARREPTIAALARERYVESAQALNIFYAMSDVRPAAVPAYNDPHQSLQHGLALMQVPEAHQWATGKGVRVAVIDTGVDTRHPDLQPRVVGIRNFVDRDTRAFNADVHGTAVAGVIAAVSNNGVGLVGVAPEADIVGLKACWQSNDAPSGAHCSSFTLAKALSFAIDQGVQVINLSVGGPADPLLARLIAKALERNIIVVGATSAKWQNGFPGTVAGVIAVADPAADPAFASSLQYVSAPGNQVLSARPNNEYDFFSGSSFSTAHVAGLAALIRQRRPELAASAVRDLISSTAQAEPRGANACRALVQILSAGECKPVPMKQAAKRP